MSVSTSFTSKMDCVPSLRCSSRISAFRVAESGSAIRIRIIWTSLVVYDKRGPNVSAARGVFYLASWIVTRPPPPGGHLPQNPNRFYELPSPFFLSDFGGGRE